MQKLLLWFTLLLTILHCQAVNAEQLTPDALTGKWRGKLQMNPQAALILGINITHTDTGYQLTLDSPNQGMFQYSPSQFTIEGNIVQFQDDKLNASFNGALHNGQLAGEFKQGKTLPLSLTKLDDTKHQLLANEGSWFGDLIISDSARLPLVLNIALGADGYHVTLDSPKQQTFGIPVEQFTISNETLEFTSKLIKANYSAVWQDDSWQGTFVQGSAMPLTLKKKPG